MNIITPGVLPPKPVLRGTCEWCSAHVEAAPSDLMFLSELNPWATCGYVRCPTTGCGEIFAVSRSNA